MGDVNALVRRLIHLRAGGRTQITLLAVCPNSAAVLEAAIVSAARSRAPLLFAATLNQVDRDGGYTGWTPAEFVGRMRAFAREHAWAGPLYPCLDHGGPWLKDDHAQAGLTLEETTAEVKRSLTACLAAGYALLHIDATVDRTLPESVPPSVDTVVARTVDLIAFAEAERRRLGLPSVAYEVGTEEVHGGLADPGSFERFIHGLRAAMTARGLLPAWPCFIVGKVGTDLHTTDFDDGVAARLTETVTPFGSLIKGHYTDWVANPEDYPASGMGGANIGPELTAVEYRALADLAARERDLLRGRPELRPSRFLDVLERAVEDSGRWRKWLLPEEQVTRLADLHPERREWLVQTGCRYVWTAPAVEAARQSLYNNLRPAIPDPHRVVVDRIAATIDRYMTAFHLVDSLTLLAA